MEDFGKHFYKDGSKLKYVGPTPKSVLKALDISIAKWSFLLDTHIPDGGPYTCGLCMVYFWSTSPCKGCPIAEAGNRLCRETPCAEYNHSIGRHDFDRARDAAQREVEFLKSLRSQYENSEVS